MKMIRFLGLVMLLLLLWFFTGCELTELTDVDFAAGIMKAVVDKGYVEDNAKSVLVYEQGGLTVFLAWIDDDPSDGETTAQFSVSFAGYESESSAVDGDLLVDVTITYVGAELDTLTAVFNTGLGSLIVTGEHAGEYQFVDATVTYDFDTGEYSYSGVVIIDGVEHTL
jgi:hypothetical protein